jgi:hypothetical protein
LDRALNSFFAAPPSLFLYRFRGQRPGCREGGCTI